MRESVRRPRGAQRSSRDPQPRQPADVREESAPAADSASPATSPTIQSGGQPLASETQQQMEPFFGHDFSQVRVHADSAATESAAEHGAAAYTVGNDVIFGAGAYSPETDQGQRLIAHELTHVVQQRAASTPAPQAQSVAGQSTDTDSDPLEAEAEQAALEFSIGDVPIFPEISEGAISEPTVQREGGDNFQPMLYSEPDMHFTFLNDDVEQDVAVMNASLAPDGTAFTWRWAADINTNMSDKLEPFRAEPDEGSRAILPARTKSVFEEATPTPEVVVDTPDGTREVSQAPPVTITVEEPDYFVMYTVTGGALSPESERDMNKMFVGDTLHVTLAFEKITDAQTAGMEFLWMHVGVHPEAAELDVSPTQWVDARTASWEIRARNAGHSLSNLSVTIPGMDQGFEESFEITAVNNARHFKDRCSTASARAIDLFNAADQYFKDASANYNQGYKAHEAAINAENVRQKLIADLLLGVLFAAVGGAAGGAMSGLLKTTGQRIETAIEGTAGRAVSGAFIDASKDLTKYIARLPTRLQGSAGGGDAPGAEGPAGEEGGLPTAPAGARGRGGSAPAAVDPFSWYLDVEKALTREKGEVTKKLTALNNAADNILATDPDEFEIDWDPVQVIENAAMIDDTPFDALGDVPSADDYEKAFWATWLSQYAWTVVGRVTNAMTEQVRHSATENVGKDLRERINKIAEKFGESGDDWIRIYGADAKRAAEEYAERLNEITEW